MAARKPREITFAEIRQSFELANYWFGQRWCPAVERKGNGYSIRVIKSVTVSGTNRNFTYEYFELADDGTVLVAPRGFARDYKPGRVVDIEAAAEQFATPDPIAMRIGGGW